MVRIRLARVGRKNDPSFRIVVQDGRTDPFGRHIEIVGTLSPRHKKQTLKTERITYWLGQGAQPTASVNNLLINAGVIKGRKINVYHPKRTAVEAAAKPAAPAAEPVKTEAPAATPAAETPQAA